MCQGVGFQVTFSRTSSGLSMCESRFETVEAALRYLVVFGRWPQFCVPDEILFGSSVLSAEQLNTVLLIPGT